MEKKPFKEHHLLQLLDGYTVQMATRWVPMDRWIHQYFRQNPALGSKDRAYIAETAYALLRWQGLLDQLPTADHSWEQRLALFLDFSPETHLDNETIPLHHRMSFPQELFDLIVNSHGMNKAKELCLASNTPAPTTVRANTLKTTRDALIARWRDSYEVTSTLIAPYGIQFAHRLNFFQLPEFKEGLFEVQDEGSQLVAEMVDAKPGDLVLDFCAGSGGKALALAPKLEGKGQLYLHDIRAYALQEAKLRLRRAGIQNGQVIQHDSKTLKSLKKKMDWVLVDAPCTGTGTIRRNPDMKWNFTTEALTRLLGQQRTIFERALSYLKPTGTIVFATCSLLKEENALQVAHFLKTYDLVLVGSPLETLPSVGGMDGFFSAAMKMKA